MKRFLELIAGLTALSVLLSSCASRPSANVAQSNLHRDTDPGAPNADVSSLVDGNNTFAFSLYQALHSQDGNFIFSPYSVSLALAMTYAGARAQTESQMAQALHYTLAQDRLHPAFNQLDLDLTRESQPASQDEHRLQLKIANAIWAEQTFSFLQEYLDLIAHNYGAGVQLADFVHQSEAVRKQINDWVTEQTEKKIKDLIPDGALDQTTKMVLVNALYFKADWQEQFDPSDTHDAPFTLLDGSQVQSHQMSNHLAGVPYVSGDGYQAVELAYQGNTAAMDLIVPDTGTFKDFENGLDAQKLNQIAKDMQPVTIQIGLPKFTFSSAFDLGDRLAALGMPDAFNPDLADFSGMTGMRDLYIAKVLHQAFVSVDEKGTEAAAAASVIMAPSSALVPDKQFIIDRPFVFVIRSLSRGPENGQILFIGRVLDPTK